MNNIHYDNEQINHLKWKINSIYLYNYLDFKRWHSITQFTLVHTPSVFSIYLQVGRRYTVIVTLLFVIFIYCIGRHVSRSTHNVCFNQLIRHCIPTQRLHQIPTLAVYASFSTHLTPHILLHTSLSQWLSPHSLNLQLISSQASHITYV